MDKKLWTSEVRKILNFKKCLWFFFSSKYSEKCIRLKSKFKDGNSFRLVKILEKKILPKFFNMKHLKYEENSLRYYFSPIPPSTLTAKYN